MNEFLMFNAPLIGILALMILTVILVGCSLEALRIWTRHKEKMATALNAQAAEKAAQYAAGSERLEQRVRVLERIATDRGIEVADEIEALRDAPPALN